MVILLPAGWFMVLPTCLVIYILKEFKVVIISSQLSWILMEEVVLSARIQSG